MHLAVRLPSDNIEQSSLFQQLTNGFVQIAKVHLRPHKVHLLGAPKVAYALVERYFEDAPVMCQAVFHIIVIPADIFSGIASSIVSTNDCASLSSIAI